MRKSDLILLLFHRLCSVHLLKGSRVKAVKYHLVEGRVEWRKILEQSQPLPTHFAVSSTSKRPLDELFRELPVEFICDCNTHASFAAIEAGRACLDQVGFTT